MEYLVNGVHFDGFRNGTLIDAKDWQEAVKFIDGNGKFFDWFAQKALREANDQMRARGRHPIQWVFSDSDVANAFRGLFQREGIDIGVLWVPAAP